MLARYRYRLYPTVGQQEMLARTFGCVRVVFNDALRFRDGSHAAGVKVTDTDVQRQVITAAKNTAERAWLAGVPSTALVQAVNDSHRAYRNWFSSMSGKRKGRKVGKPRFRSRRDNRQSFRLTRNSFSLKGQPGRERLYLQKIGQVEVAWSRALPSAPSSVTVIKEADGRYYASFVVERGEQPLPPVEAEVGVDVGLNHLAVLSTGEKIANPRFLRKAQRRLAAAQRALSRKQKGSANRAKARHRVAVAHRKVRETRLDHAHKLALNVVRENQAIYVEDLNTAGIAKTRLAKSIHDAGWSQLLRLIEEKAAYHHRHFAKIGRYAPSSRVCHQCGHNDGAKALHVRAWDCGNCGAHLDRDVNAALNILAWGHQERQNAYGGQVSPPFGAASADEVGTRLIELAA